MVRAVGKIQRIPNRLKASFSRTGSFGKQIYLCSWACGVVYSEPGVGDDLDILRRHGLSCVENRSPILVEPVDSRERYTVVDRGSGAADESKSRRNLDVGPVYQNVIIRTVVLSDKSGLRIGERGPLGPYSRTHRRGIQRSVFSRFGGLRTLLLQLVGQSESLSVYRTKCGIIRYEENCGDQRMWSISIRTNPRLVYSALVRPRTPRKRSADIQRR